MQEQENQHVAERKMQKVRMTRAKGANTLQSRTHWTACICRKIANAGTGRVLRVEKVKKAENFPEKTAQNPLQFSCVSDIIRVLSVQG